MALDLGEHDDTGRRELQTLLGGALVNSGRSAEAAELFLAASDAPDPMQRLDLRRRAAEHFLNAGLIERGVETLRAVLAEIGEDLPASSGAALRSFIWHYLRLRMSSLRWTPRDASQIPPRELFRLDCYITIGLSLGMVDPILGGLYQAKGLGVALKLGEQSRIFKIAAIHTIFLFAQGSTARGQTVLARCEQIAERSKDPFQAAWVLTLRGFATYFAGQYDQAEGLLDSAQQRFLEETTGTIAEINHTRVFHLQTLRFQGRFAALREVFEEYLRDARHRGDQYVKTTLHRAFALRFLAEDDVEAAREALAAAWWSPPEKGFHLQHWYELRAGAELLLYTGEGDASRVREQMQGLVSSRMLRIQIIRAEAASFRLRLALTGMTEWNPKKEIAALRKEGVPFAAVWAGLGAAALATGEGRVRELRDTAKLAEEHGMFACAHAARWRLGETLGGDEGESMIAEARAAIAALGVACPERMLEVIAPMGRAAGATGG
jgi:tetratricopeptide (TPR) repeat protein